MNTGSILVYVYCSLLSILFNRVQMVLVTVAPVGSNNGQPKLLNILLQRPIGSPRGSKPPLASLSSSQERSESRPRRKLPTPPTHHLPFSMTTPRASDMSDHESPTKGRVSMVAFLVDF